MLRAATLLAIVLMLIAAARSFLPEETSLVGSGAALAFGCILLAALQTGKLFAGVGLPRLTGYLICGFVVGPSILNYVTDRMLADLKLVNGVAIGLIALSAGGELNFKRLKPRLAAILSICGLSFMFVTFLVSSTVFVVSTHLPFMHDMTLVQRVAVSLTIGVVLSAISPSVTLALINETGASGPISETILGLVVLADLVVVLGFAGINGFTSASFGLTGDGNEGLRPLMIHLFGSMGVGAVLGLVFAIYVKRIGQRLALFVFGVCFFAAEAGVRLHLDPLLMCLTAGLFVENATDVEGTELIKGIEAASMPVFAVFFAVAGAGLHWDVFKSVAIFAVLFAVVRAVGMQLGGRVGMAVGKVPTEHRKFIPYGMLSQSGVTIGLAILIGKQYPGWGDGARACVLGTAVVNELVGPVLLRQALMRSGEAGRRAVVAGAH